MWSPDTALIRFGSLESGHGSRRNRKLVPHSVALISPTQDDLFQPVDLRKATRFFGCDGDGRPRNGEIYSWRRAMTGSTLVARRVGKKAASAATRIKTMGTAM